MMAAQTVYDAVRRYTEDERAGKVDEKWMQNHPHDMNIWTQVQLLRAKTNA